MEKIKLRVILEPQKEGGFTVTVPSLPGCISEGETEEEALKNIREAIELYLEPIEDIHFGKVAALREKTFQKKSSLTHKQVFP